jgi:hypothetical protein
MGRFMFVSILTLAFGCAEAKIDVGALDQKDPPAAKDLMVPESDDGVTKVSLRATITGTFKRTDSRKVWILVNPLTNATTKNTWWVQEAVARGMTTFSGSAQFGEVGQGEGEFFAILVLATDKDFTVGEQLNGVPMQGKAALSKLKIVKRSK